MSFFLLAAELKGLKDFERFLSEAERKRTKDLRKRLKEAADLVASSARGHTHSQRVRSAMNAYVAVKSTTEYRAMVGPLRRKAFFAHFLELGTEHSGAFPFMAPALRDTTDRVVELIGRAFAFPGPRQR